MHPESFIFDRMTKKERELYKEANNSGCCLPMHASRTHASRNPRIESSGRAPVLVANKRNYFIIPKLTVKRFRNAPLAIALESHPQLKNHVPGLSQPRLGLQFKRILSYQTSTYCESHHDEGPMILDRVISIGSYPDVLLEPCIRYTHDLSHLESR
jgi:hypothetical protein